jgi:hypothetical protein
MSILIGIGIQKNCAILGVHPKNMGTTWEQNTLFFDPFCAPSSVRATESSGVMVGAVGIEHDPPIFKSRNLMALQPPTKFNC